MEIQLNNILVSQAAAGLQQGVFCGISTGVSVRASGRRIRALHSAGVTRNDDQGNEVQASTLFDLASLTKPLCTLLCTLHLITKGKLQWQSTLGQLYPRDKQHIRLQDILQHASGFPAYHPYFQSFLPVQHKKNKKQLLRRIREEPLLYPTGSRSLYSDLGFIALGDWIEQVCECSLHHLFCTQIAAPIGVEDTLLFLPIGESGARNCADIAATEVCQWRQTTLQGAVHDEHCWLMGGVAGHAGLFGTVEAVMRLCECLLDIWKGRITHPAFAAPVLIQALTNKHPHSSWCLGFDTPTPGTSSSGRYFSTHSVGHLGFSGTSFWIDPEREVVVVLLTNRIHPTRDNVMIRQFRPAFHDHLMQAIIAGGS